MTIDSTANPARAPLVRGLWLFAAALILHEAEEWNIAPWFERHFSNNTGIDSHAIWVGLILMSSVFVAWIWISTRFSSTIVVALVALPAVAFVAFGNALQHVAWAILFREYAPGLVTAVVLVIPSVGLVVARSARVHRGLVWYAGVLLAIGTFGAVQTYGWGSELTSSQVSLHHLIMSLTSLLGLGGAEGAI